MVLQKSLLFLRKLQLMYPIGYKLEQKYETQNVAFTFPMIDQ